MKHEQRISLPEWLSDTKENHGYEFGRAGMGFLRKTVIEVSRIFENDVLAERYASKGGLLQHIDPRIKFFSMLYLIMFCGITTSIAKLIALVCVSLIFAKLSNLGITTYIKRVWLVLPVIVLIVSVPAATNVILPGKPLFYVYKNLDFFVMPHQLFFSEEGLLAIIRMALRIGCSVSFAYCLIMSTRWTILVKSLRALKIPMFVIAILDMTYRFIFVLVRLTVDIFEARFLRTVGRIKNKENRNFIARSIAFLFAKSNHMSEEIYEAMVCRGYTGEPVALGDLKLSVQDVVWVLNILIISVILAAI
ncbi:MAG: cobalt ECF transporter T component CbiQ [Clostridia bacterium]|nr:cobalt ECF transporter T component CbiQ [Clostridia bacterium]